MYKSPRSAYVHIPFCHRRCFYCDFSVIPIGDEISSENASNSESVNEYLYFLKKEILSIKHKSSLSTIYIGGGTPSILNPTQIADIIKIFKKYYGIDNGAELSMEIDPGSFNEKDLYGYIKAGINRFSLGVQSFNNKILTKAGRRHRSIDAEQSCRWLNQAYKNNYIKSWSLDLIQNLPSGGFISWKYDLEKTLTFNPPHLSIYDLILEEGTVFKRLKDLGKLNLPDDNESFENSKITSNILKKYGYLRYEISNYSIPGHQSRHNRVYWKGLGWWSFGQGSTSSPWGVKFTRPGNSKDYKQWVIFQCKGTLEKSLNKISTKNVDLDEKIMLGMRVREGVNLQNLFKEEGWDDEKIEFNIRNLLEIWNKYRTNGLLSNEGRRFFLSDPKGMELSNQVLISMFRWWEKVN